MAIVFKKIFIILVVIGNIYARANVRDESVLANIAKINPSRTLVILQYVPPEVWWPSG